LKTTVAAGFLAAGPSAVPASPPNSISSNEAAAVATLRNLAAVQETFKAAAHIDTNCDGVGEYGYFAELAGSRPMRIAVGDPCVPGTGSEFHDLLRPPLLRSQFGDVRYGCVVSHGYVFQMWLPGTPGDAHVEGCREDYLGGKQAAPFPDPANGAHFWCCYAWPLDHGHTGRRVFFVNQRGRVLEYANRTTSPISGLPVDAPWIGVPFDEAYSRKDDMSSPPRIGIPNASGTIWWPVP
jgi:hypothetical protein